MHKVQSRVLAVLACFLLLFSGCTSAVSESTPASGSKDVLSEAGQPPEQKTVAYKTVEGKELLMDIYYPDTTEKKHPVMVAYHGGGWQGGNRSEMEYIEMLLALRAEGFIVVSADYRLADSTTRANGYPVPIIDSCDAIRYLVKNSEELHVDTERICTTGGSAGGHLAALASLAGDVFPSDTKELEGIEYEVAACVPGAGVYDFELIANWAAARQPGQDQYEVAAEIAAGFLQAETEEELKEMCIQASPVTYVRAAKNKQVEFLILHGDSDTIVPYEQAELFYAELNENGYAARLYKIKGMGHTPAEGPQETVYPQVVKVLDEIKGILINI